MSHSALPHSWGRDESFWPADSAPGKHHIRAHGLATPQSDMGMRSPPRYAPFPATKTASIPSATCGPTSWSHSYPRTSRHSEGISISPYERSSMMAPASVDSLFSSPPSRQPSFSDQNRFCQSIAS
jgi:hypothetical protein